MVEMEIDIAKMPLGRLSRSQLSSAFSTLGEITAILEDQARVQAHNFVPVLLGED